MRVAGILLAAGGASRFGRPKLRLPVPGGTLLGQAARALTEASLFRVVVVLGADAEEHRRALPASPRLRVAENPLWAEGLSTSIRAGLRAAGRPDAVLLALADQPGLTAERVAAVAGAWDGRAPLVVPAHGGRAGHPVLVARALFPELRALAGDVGAREVVRRHRARAIVVDLPPLGDVDTEEDYRQLRAGTLPAAEGLLLGRSARGERRPPPSYRVYVIELDDRAGRRLRADLPCVYVGQTADTPEERFAEHRRGHRASRWVRRFGVRLRPDLYASLPRLATREQAEVLERRTALELRRRGYRVFGGH